MATVAYQAKVQTHLTKTLVTQPELMQISTVYGAQKEGSPVFSRNKYTAIRNDKPKSKEEAKRPEFKVCKFAAAIITEGSYVGAIHQVYANPFCPVHHPRQPASRDNARWKIEQEKQGREQAVAETTNSTSLPPSVRLFPYI